MQDHIKHNTLIKLAQTRLAINYVLRTRAMQKSAWCDPFDDRYYNLKGERNWLGFWAGAPPRKPVVTHITGNTPETKNTVMVTVPGYPNKTMWFNQDSDKNTNGIGAKTLGVIGASTVAGGTIGGLTTTPGGPLGVGFGITVGGGLGASGAMTLANIKAILNNGYRNNMRDALKAHGANPDMTYKSEF